MTVARPRLVWVSCWWSNTLLGASQHLCPPILFPLLLNKGELARTFRAPKSVGDDTWQLGPDWHASTTRRTLSRRRLPYLCLTAHWPSNILSIAAAD